MGLRCRSRKRPNQGEDIRVGAIFCSDDAHRPSVGLSSKAEVPASEVYIIKDEPAVAFGTVTPVCCSAGRSADPLALLPIRVLASNSAPSGVSKEPQRRVGGLWIAATLLNGCSA